MESNCTDAHEDQNGLKFEIDNRTVNFEQKQSRPVAMKQREQIVSQSLQHRTLYGRITGHFWVVLLLLIVIGGIGIAYIPRQPLTKEDRNIIQRQVRSVHSDWQKKYGSNQFNSGRNSKRHFARSENYDTMNSEGAQPHQIRTLLRRSESPEKIGHMNIYISQAVEGSSQRRLEQFAFPVARYKRSQFPLTGPFLNFIPWMPIFADQSTRQTIIHSSTGVYLLPSLINIYGTLYSVAELIASDYASLVGTSVQPSFIDMTTYFQSTPILGPGVPSISATTGGFQGSVRTDFGFFNLVKESELLVYKEDSEEQEHNDIGYQPPPYVQKRHDRRSRHHKKPPVTQRPSGYTSTTSSTTTTRTTPISGPKEVHQTLIIDELFPYSKSRKPIISANYSFPGPLLEAYENDTFVIRVINRLDIPSTIHWHGMRQYGTPDMDGAVGITQCAIPPHDQITYRFKAEPSGTTWYHGHLLEQYTDGLYGPMIIHQRNDPNKKWYDSEQILMIADWYNKPAHTDLLPWYLNPNNPDGNEPSPDAIVVNGKFTQSLFISLLGSRRVLFRIINTASFSMYTVSIDGLPLHIIEVDTTTTNPYTVNSFSINVAQRVSFYIDLNEVDPIYTSIGTSPTNALFIRIEASLSMYPVDILNYIPPYEGQRYPYPTFFNPLYVAILSFDSSNSTPTYPISQDVPIPLNTITPQETNLLDARPYDQNIGGIPKATHYLNLVIEFDLDADGINRPYVNNVTYSSDANYMHMRPDPKQGITSDLYAPLLHQMANKPKQLGIPSPSIEGGNSLPTIQSDGNGHYLIPYQSVLYIFLNNTDGGEHPFHLHGHTFWIISTSDYPEAEYKYANDYIERDTVSIPPLGWAKILFVANNPGAWFFHCHIEWHMTAGLAVALLVSPSELLSNGYTITQTQKQLCQDLRQFNAENGSKL